MEKVLKGLECCSHCGGEWCRKCPYNDESNGDAPTCTAHLAHDAHQLLTIKQMDIEAMKNAMQSMIEGRCAIVGGKQSK